MATFFIENFGCRATEADAASLRRSLRASGLQMLDERAGADVVVLNTCTVTAAADSQARDAVRKIHRANPSARIVVTGCYAQRAPEELASLDGVWWVIGNSHQAEIPRVIREGLMPGGESPTAATDSSGGRYSADGFSAKELDKFKKADGKLADYSQGQKIDNDELLGFKVDVLMLAALEDAVNEQNVRDIKAKIVLELANGPVSYDAYKTLSDKDVIDVPDILANSGGVIVSYLEWVQNKNGEHWAEDKVNRELENYLVKATDKVYERMQKDKMTLKEAVFAEAIVKLIS